MDVLHDFYLEIRKEQEGKTKYLIKYLKNQN